MPDMQTQEGMIRRKLLTAKQQCDETCKLISSLLFPGCSQPQQGL